MHTMRPRPLVVGIQFAAALVASAWLFVLTSRPSRAQSFDLEQGKKALEEKNDEAAIAYFGVVIFADPKNAEAYYERGMAYLYRYQDCFLRGSESLTGEDLGRSIQDFNEAIRLDPKRPDAYRGRGITYYTLKKYE